MGRMKDLFAVVCEAQEASSDGRPRFSYHIIGNDGRHRDIYSVHGPDSAPIQRLVRMNRTVLLAGKASDGWGEEIESRILEPNAEAAR